MQSPTYPWSTEEGERIYIHTYMAYLSPSMILPVFAQMGRYLVF